MKDNMVLYVVSDQELSLIAQALRFYQAKLARQILGLDTEQLASLSSYSTFSEYPLVKQLARDDEAVKASMVVLDEMKDRPMRNSFFSLPSAHHVTVCYALKLMYDQMPQFHIVEGRRMPDTLEEWTQAEHAGLVKQMLMRFATLALKERIQFDQEARNG